MEKDIVLETNLNQLKTYRKKISELTEKEKRWRDIYLKKLNTSKLYGPLTGLPSLDEPWMRYYDEKNIDNQLPKMTLYDYMYLNNKSNNKDVLIRYFDNKISFELMINNIKKAENSLRKLGVKKGDIVSICSVTVPETIYMIYAINKIGAISNIIDPRTNLATITRNINLTNSNLIFTLDELIPVISESIDDSCVKKVISCSSVNSADLLTKVGFKLKSKNHIPLLSKDVISWSNFLNYGKDYDCKLEEVYEENFPAAIVYTSGSETGNPKPVVLTNDNINSIVHQYKYSGIPIKRGDKELNIMPPFLAYGLVNGIHLPTTLGVCNIPIPKFDPLTLSKLLKKYKPEHYMGIPNHYNYLIHSDVDFDLSFLKTPGMGGAPITNELEKDTNDFLSKHNCKSKLQKGYGMTELCAPAATCTDKVNKIGSVGIPLINNTISIFVPNSDVELGINKVGEICVKGPGIMKGYYGNVEMTSKIKYLHNDGDIWVHTGDAGYIDEDGLLFVTGRIKNIIQRPDGHNNYPNAIENVIESCPLVEKCAVTTIDLKDKNEFGEVPIAFIVLNNKENDTSYSSIYNYCLDNMPKRDVACHYIFVDDLPTNNSGKIDYVNLKEKLKEIIYNEPKVLDIIYNNYLDTIKIEKTLHI